MYQYVYDGFLGDKRYKKLLAELENRLTDLGIHGRIDRLSPFKSLRESMDDAIRSGVRTVVAVGSDETMKKVLDVVPGKGVGLGFIPLETPSVFADMFGIPEGVAACDILSARLTATLDIGRVNGQYFLAAVTLPAERLTLECEGRYRVQMARGGRVSVCNIGAIGGRTPHVANPYDGFLDAVFEPGTAGTWFRDRTPVRPSVFPIRRVVARAEKPFTFFADGRELKGETAEIDLASEKLKVIIGKSRVFA